MENGRKLGDLPDGFCVRWAEFGEVRECSKRYRLNYKVCLGYFAYPKKPWQERKSCRHSQFGTMVLGKAHAPASFSVVASCERKRQHRAATQQGSNRSSTVALPVKDASSCEAAYHGVISHPMQIGGNNLRQFARDKIGGLIQIQNGHSFNRVQTYQPLRSQRPN